VKTVVALVTRDLRLADNRMLRAALDSAESVLPLFVRDADIERSRSVRQRASRRSSMTRSPTSTGR
jgi:deoxyribodipyrimidine photolyase